MSRMEGKRNLYPVPLVNAISMQAQQPLGNSSARFQQHLHCSPQDLPNTIPEH